MNAKNTMLPDKVVPGEPVEVQLSPKGHYGQIVDGKDVVQVVDDEAIETLVKNFDADVLVDADHASEDGKGTKAEAWVKRVFADPDRGLVGVFEFTDLGADDVNNKRYRFISPAWTLGSDGRPEKLVSVGMTNKPNLPVAPVLNMRVPGEAAEAGAESPAGEPEGQAAKAAGEGKAANEEPKAESETVRVVEANEAPAPVADEEKPEASNETAAPVVDGNPPPEGEPKQEGDPKMDQLKEVLGLPPEATDEEVLEAVKAILAKCEGAEKIADALGLEPTANADQMVEAINAVVNQCGALQEAQKNAEAEAFVAEAEDVAETPEEKEELKNQYLENADAAKACVANARKMAQRVVANMKAKAEAEAVKAEKPIVNARQAAEPVVVVNSMDGIASCGGDPEKENAWIKANCGK